MPLDISLQPAQTEVVALPGSTIIQAYEVVNNSSDYLTASTQVLPWTPQGSAGSVDYSHVPANPYLHFSLGNSDLILGQSFTLGPHQKRQLVLKIKSDQNTPQSDIYYTFFINQNPGSSVSNFSQASASGRIGSHLLISYSLSEQPHSQFSLSHFQVYPRFIDIFYPQIKFSAQAFNSSPFFAKISGKLTISKNNRLLQEYDLFPHNVLADSRRDLTCLRDNQPVDCTFSPPFWPGAYTATLTLDPGLNAPSAVTTFFVFPYSVTFFLAVLFSLFWFFHRRR